MTIYDVFTRVTGLGDVGGSETNSVDNFLRLSQSIRTKLVAHLTHCTLLEGMLLVSSPVSNP